MNGTMSRYAFIKSKVRQGTARSNFGTSYTQILKLDANGHASFFNIALKDTTKMLMFFHLYNMTFDNRKCIGES